MGLNSNAQQPATPLTPQQQQAQARLAPLRSFAVRPYQGTAPGGGLANGAAQLAAALIAKRRQDALRNGNPAGTMAIPQPSTGPVPLPQPGAQMPAPAAGPMPPNGAPALAAPRLNLAQPQQPVPNLNLQAPVMNAPPGGVPQ